MIVGVNLLFCVPGVVGGSEDYTVAMLRSFAEHGPPDIELRVFALESFRVAHPALADSFVMETLDLSGAMKPARVVAESTWLDRRVRTHRVTLQHHFGGRIPARSSGRHVLTLHDLQPLEQPQNFSRTKQRFLARSIPASVDRADKIIAVSESVRQRIIERFALSEDRVVALPSGLGPDGTVCGTLPSNLPDRFVVYPAVTHPHKNHTTLLQAFERLQRTGSDLHLVLVGGRGASARAVEEEISSRGLDSVVHHLGRVEHTTVNALLAASEALVFASTYEGFGLPVLEALAMRTAVIASDIDPINSYATAVATLIDPLDVDGWVSALVDLPTFNADASSVVLEGFSPRSRADGLASVYRSVAS